MNPFDLFKNLQGLQQKMQEMQERVKLIEEVGTAGAGMVKVTMDGGFKLTAIEISPSICSGPDDASLVAELVKLASQEAWEKVRARMQSEMGGLQGLFPGMPG